MRISNRSKYLVVPALLSLMAVVTLVPAHAEDSDEGPFSARNARTEIVPNTSSDRNSQGDSHQDFDVCNSAQPGEASCVAIERAFYSRGSRISNDLRPSAPVPRVLPGYNATQIRTAYGITETGSANSVIAIVDAYSYPTALADLNAYRANYGSDTTALTACTITNNVPAFPTATTGRGCFAQVNQTGKTNNLPRSNTGWNQEAALDIEMATAICPNCSILLVAANSASFADLNTAVGAAKNFSNVKAISNSYGGADFRASGLGAINNYEIASRMGIAVTASSGDSAYGVSAPASFSNVIGVGGTTLNLNSNNTRLSESVWYTSTTSRGRVSISGTGSGCSTLNLIPAAQSSTITTCAGKAISDISAVADPATGVGVIYNNGFYVFGGTSVSSPIIASMFAASAFAPSGTTYANSLLWRTTVRSTYYDVTDGKNLASCATGNKLCSAVVGWDGPTGFGTPNGTAVFRP